MKAILTTTALTLALAAPVAAQSTMDTDGDGNVSLEELQTAFPDASTDTFAAIDTDADGVLSDVELQAAVDAGILPAG